MLDKKQLSLAAILLVLIAAFFWTQSRFPALDQKAQMGARTTMSSIAFDVIVPIEGADAYGERVVKSAINWGYTNWKGMTFGVLFAAAFLTLLRLLPTFKDSKYRVLNSLKGMIIGVPLGVCANCSTPIAHGMVRAGTKLETALSTLVSSPTLNIFVLTMTFSLLPFHVAALKVIGVFVTVIIVIPLLVRFFANTAESDHSLPSISAPTTPSIDSTNACEAPSVSWGQAVASVFQKYSANLLLIIKETVPLMLLAGVLGALAIESLPFGWLQSLEVTVLSVLLISLVGAFLPVPIAFDIIVVATLLASGFAVGLGGALVFSLGIFSVYPAMVIARQISVKLSLALLASITLLGLAIGLSADLLDEQLITDSNKDLDRQIMALDTKKNDAAIIEKECKASMIPEDLKFCVDSVTNMLETPVDKPLIDPSSCAKKTGMEQHFCMAKVSSHFAVASMDLTKCNLIPMEDIRRDCKIDITVNKVKALAQLNNPGKVIDPAKPKQSESTPQIARRNETMAKPKAWTLFHKGDGLVIHQHTFDVSAGKQGFTRELAKNIGIDLRGNFDSTEFFEPFKYGRGIASGDINNDGNADLVFATKNGPKIYRNDGHGYFYPINYTPLESTSINTFVVALVDVNNDGWQDLFYSTYGGSSYLIPNHRGALIADQTIQISVEHTNLTMAVGFYDKQLDGDMDMLLGNWTAGAENQFAIAGSQNTWAEFADGAYKLSPDGSVKGETLSILFSDFNHDNQLDLIVANDNQGPDHYYLGSKGSEFNPVVPQARTIPSTSLTTMSVDSADFNNDLRLDLFTSDMSFAEGETEDYCGEIKSESDKTKCYQALQAWRNIKNLNTGFCNELEANQVDCVNAMVLMLAKTSKDGQVCGKLPANRKDLTKLCQQMASRLPQPQYDLSSHIEQVQANRLLLGTSDGHFTEATDLMNADNTFWSWNSKAADLDNDGWQDILVSNGFGFGEQQNEIHSNVFLHNQSGKGFARAANEFGLSELLNTPTYTYLDLDLDGDLDIISTAIMTSPQVFLNHSSANRIAFELRDFHGNRFCVGCKIIIKDHAGMEQLREIKLSGGFMSFDYAAAYFGLGEAEAVKEVTVIWANGERDTFSNKFEANTRYKITRLSN